MNGAGGKRRGRPKTVDREHTIQSAMEIYWSRGLNALSLNEMCRATGISKPGLYREFGGEEGLMVAALERYRQMFVLPLLSLFGSDQPAAEVIDRAVVVTTEDRGTPAGCLFTVMRLSARRLGTTTAARVRAIEQERRDAFEAWFRRGRNRGEVAPGLSPEFAARYLDNQLTLLLVQMGMGEPHDAVRAETRLALSALLPPEQRA